MSKDLAKATPCHHTAKVSSGSTIMSGLQHNRHPQVPSNGGGADSIWADSANLSRSRVANRRLARSHYENFFITSFLLPRPLHQPFYDIYAFCRTADDLADELSSDQESLSALASMENDLRNQCHLCLRRNDLKEICSSHSRIP